MATPRCRNVTFKRGKGGRKLAKQNWVTVRRCKGKTLKAHNRRQCRKGGANWRKSNRKDAHLFTRCR